MKCFAETPKGSPRVDKPAEYTSPPARPNNKHDNGTEDKAISSHKEENNNISKPTEPVKVVDLSKMSSKELTDHVEGLRNTVRRLQETECSFVKEVEDDDPGRD